MKYFFANIFMAICLLAGTAGQSVLAQAAGQAVGDAGFIEEKYIRLAEGGDPRAQFYLGLMHETGVAHNSDITKAGKWYRKSAAQNFAPALFKMGLLHQSGALGEANLVQSAIFYQQAADLGVAEAQYNLGYLYETGQGVTRNFRLAADWYEKSAIQGIGHAMRALAVLYYRGLGVEKDAAWAWVWNMRAVDMGDEKAVSLAVELNAILTPAEVARAEDILSSQ